MCFVQSSSPLREPFSSLLAPPLASLVAPTAPPTLDFFRPAKRREAWWMEVAVGRTVAQPENEQLVFRVWWSLEVLVFVADAPVGGASSWSLCAVVYSAFRSEFSGHHRSNGSFLPK